MSVKTKASPIYHGDKNNVNFDYDGSYRYLNLPCEHVHRVSNIFYSNIEDEYGNSIGYEGMRSFAITKSNLTNASLSYWLNQKSLYSPGLMKAAYGTFLTAYLVIWEMTGLLMRRLHVSMSHGLVQHQYVYLYAMITIAYISQANQIIGWVVKQ